MITLVNLWQDTVYMDGETPRLLRRSKKQMMGEQPDVVYLVSLNIFKMFPYRNDLVYADDQHLQKDKFGREIGYVQFTGKHRNLSWGE